MSINHIPPKYAPHLIEENVTLDRINTTTHIDMQGNIHAIDIEIDGVPVKVHKIFGNTDITCGHILHMLSYASNQRRLLQWVQGGGGRLINDSHIKLRIEYSLKR